MRCARCAAIFATAVLLPGAARSDSAPTWMLHVGHSYTSATALRQPATFEFSADLGRPTLSKIDIGLLIDGAFAQNGHFEVGARVSGGSVRSRSERVFAGMLQTWKSYDPIVVAAGGEYEADGGFDVEKGQLKVEATPMRGLPALGAWAGPRLRLRWRPWVGVEYGNVFTNPAGEEDIEEGGFWRAHARLELHYRSGAAVVPDASAATTGADAATSGQRSIRSDSGAARFDLEATGWLLFDDPRGEGYVTAALSVPLGSGLSLVASGEAGRQPPRFVLTRRVGLGVGFSY